ncbi:MAG TPA: hypothetical protein VGM88_29830 [Kofleriaceae bacterium]|jgi:hypothetical protein
MPATGSTQSDVGLAFPAIAVLVRAILDCRSDRAPDAARLLAERWGDCEARVTGQQLRLFRVVRAFATGAATERELAALAPAWDGEHAYLGATWPEMAAFLASHDLA